MADPSRPDPHADLEAVQLVRDVENRRSRMLPFYDEMHARAERLGLFIDFENLVLGATASLPERDCSLRSGGVPGDHNRNRVRTAPWWGRPGPR